MLELKIPPPVYLLLFISLMYMFAQYMPLLTLYNASLSQLAYVFVVLGLVLDLSAVALFFRSKTTVNPLKPNNANTIITSGMYRFTRNPMYLGMLSLLIAWGIYLAAFTPFLLLPVFIWVLTTQQIIPEEQILQKKFGKDYLDYKQQVRRWI